MGIEKHWVIECEDCGHTEISWSEFLVDALLEFPWWRTMTDKKGKIKCVCPDCKFNAVTPTPKLRSGI